MILPLYEQLKTERPELMPSGNAGLWFERFFDGYEKEEKEREPEKNKLIVADKDWLKSFVQKSNKVGDDKELEHKKLRQNELMQSLNGKAVVYKTQWNFVTGMGLPHPIENGFSWHPTLGVPYLSGAAVKGIVRSWLEVWDSREDKQEQKAWLLELFGSEDKDPEEQTMDFQAGSLIFFDALPVSAVKLGVDIMTPHMGEWYAKGNKIDDIKKDSARIPADWHDPVPIKYLVVRDAQFLFSIAPRNKKCALSIDMEAVMQALEDALNWLGAGAKTAVGYGHMLKEEKETQRLIELVDEKKKCQAQQEQEELEDSQAKERMSELAFKFYKQSQVGKWEENKDAFCRDFNSKGAGESWLNKLEETQDLVLHEQIKSLMMSHYDGLMADPNKTTGKKEKYAYKEWPREIAERLNLIVPHKQ